MHIRQILVNILGNSVKFTPDGGTITFRAYESKATKKMATYRIEMEDTGRGMSPEFLEHIWEPFAQEKSEGRSKYEGTGLGMTITKNLTELMGGTIIVKSKEGVGTAFSLTLALNIDPAVGHEKAEEIDQELKNARILVVEDNALNLEIMLELLAGDTIELESAENGQIAFDMFEKSEPGYYDAILMDIMMPVMDGCEATKHIRALERPDAKEIPIIALTANAFDDDKRRTMAAGMNAHLTKPIDVEQTLQTLASFINKKRG